MGSQDRNRSEHRGAYILERGVWTATCRCCGWRASDAQRRQAATQFRQHITDMREAGGDADLPPLRREPAVVDIRGR